MPLDNTDALLAQAQYKGMLPSETAIMKRWLERHAGDFDRIDFEVRLGDGGTPDPSLSPEHAAEWRELTKKRADAIAYVGEYAVIIEVKTRLNIRDVGQLLSYRWFYLKTFPARPAPRMLAIAQRGDPDVIESLRVHGIDVELYPVTA